MSLVDDLGAWRKAGPAFWARQKKTLGQARYGWVHPKRVSFVFGCQRSGTKMVMRILENSPETRIYHENHAAAFRDFQLRDDAVLRAMVALNPAPVQVFKPICDSQEADLILGRWPRARGLWVYRHHDDVANSAAEKWGEHQRELVEAVVRGDFDTWGWRTRRLPADTISALRRVYRTDLAPSEGALLFWYMRNAFVFALGLDAHPRLRLVKYEDLVSRPVEAFRSMFAHLGARFHDAYVARVRSDSVGRREPPAASAEIRQLCAELQARLDTAYAAQPEAHDLPSPVLMAINTMGVGGAERYVAAVSNWLADRGVDVHVASTGGEVLRELRPAVRTHEVDLYRVRGRIAAPATALRELVIAHRPEVVVCHSLAVTWVARLACAGTGTPVVNVAHGWPAAAYARVGKLLRGADRVVAVSTDVRDRLVAGGLDAGRCVVVENGVDTSVLGPREAARRDAARRSMGGGAFIVVSAGRLTPQKAQHHLFDVARRCRGMHFVLVGEGTRFDELSAMAADSSLEGRVKLLGLRHDVPDLLGSADAYLSCSDWEGMSLTVIEAMASGLPVVATATEGSTRLLADDHGVVVPVGDAEAMARALLALEADPGRRAELGRRARERAQDHYGVDRMAAELAAVLRAAAR